MEYLQHQSRYRLSHKEVVIHYKWLWFFDRYSYTPLCGHMFSHDTLIKESNKVECQRCYRLIKQGKIK